ncbi:MAG: hypothetical protein VR65_10870 [Desulfobulbaceae bacterium BRH_c16a]|nr:MAG: hypothetical protein VR65_10870 [Desulfobulbaceae bacterium BRH_c16a]
MATNLWARFKRLLPGSPMIVVTVISVNSDGTSTVTTSGGGAMRVLGTTVAAPKKAYVKDGAIIGEAPNLQHFEIEV